MRKITERQKQVYEYIERYIRSESRPPTIIEIKENFGLVSNQGVADHLEALEKKGYIKRLKHSRGIVLLKKEPHFPILGQVSAGKLVGSEEFHQGNLRLEDLFDPDNSFVIRAKGNSMKNAGILNGDYIIVKHQNLVENREIAIILVDGELTVKRVIYDGRQVILRPENEDYQDIIYDLRLVSPQIVGKVTGVLRAL